MTEASTIDEEDGPDEENLLAPTDNEEACEVLDGLWKSDGMKAAVTEAIDKIVALGFSREQAVACVKNELELHDLEAGESAVAVDV